MDGFAYAGEALAGRYIGARNQPALRNTVNHLFYWGVGLSAAFTLFVCNRRKRGFLELLTNDTSVINASEHLLLIGHSPFRWPSFSAFLWDGVFIGATATRSMLYSMLIASARTFSRLLCFP
ncbi:MATE family efflux transporter [Bacteroides ovatus]|nr:MATE family efflux transporter [Bacteroides ovatus]